MKRLLKDVVKLGKSSLKLSDVKETGKYPVFGASGLVGHIDSFQSESDSVAVIKDGAGIGRVSILPSNSSVLGTMQFMTPKDNIDNGFLFYFLRHLKLGSSFTGSTIPHIYFRDYGNYTFPNETKDRQIKESGFLANIDSLILERMNILSSLDSLVKSRFNEMFGDSIINEHKFKTLSLYNCCKMTGIKNFKKADKYWLLGLDKIESGTGNIISKDFFGIKNIGSSTFYFDESYVLYSKLRPYLNKVALPDEEGFATTELVPLKPSPIINRVFLAYLLRSNSFVEWINETSSGAKMPRASMTSFRNFKLMIPPIDYQNEFAFFVKQIDKSKFFVQKQIKDLQELLDSKMDEYFGGAEE